VFVTLPRNSGVFLAVLLVFTAASPVRADESPPVPSPSPAVSAPAESGSGSNWLSQLGRDLAAPLRRPGREVLLIGAGFAAASYPFRVRVTDVAEDKPLSSTSPVGYQLGLWHINAAYVLGYLGYGWIAGDSEAIRKATLMIRATAYTGLLTTGIKGLHLEERPRKNGDMNSFPSGHASNVFAFAGVIYRNHGVSLGVPAFAMATFVAFSRINDNAHYLHDLVFGASLGLSYAFGLDTSWSSRDGARSVAFAPIVAGDRYGLGAVIDF
jgi:membrane-associated phospholipid phosphatase